MYSYLIFPWNHFIAVNFVKRRWNKWTRLAVSDFIYGLSETLTSFVATYSITWCHLKAKGTILSSPLVAVAVHTSMKLGFIRMMTIYLRQEGGRLAAARRLPITISTTLNSFEFRLLKKLRNVTSLSDFFCNCLLIHLTTNDLYSFAPTVQYTEYNVYVDNI